MNLTDHRAAGSDDIVSGMLKDIADSVDKLQACAVGRGLRQTGASRGSPGSPDGPRRNPARNTGRPKVGTGTAAERKAGYLSVIPVPPSSPKTDFARRKGIHTLQSTLSTLNTLHVLHTFPTLPTLPPPQPPDRGLSSVSAPRRTDTDGYPPSPCGPLPKFAKTNRKKERKKNQKKNKEGLKNTS